MYYHYLTCKVIYDVKAVASLANEANGILASRTATYSSEGQECTGTSARLRVASNGCKIVE